MATLFPSSAYPPQRGGLSIKEQLAASWCQMPRRPLLCATNAVTRQAILYRPNCRQWKCLYCGPQRARMFMVIAGHGYEALSSDGYAIQFATITSHRENRTLVGGLTAWRKNWPKLLRRIKRASEHVAYMQAPEQHKSGAYHVHLLTTADVSERWLKDNAARCGFGYMDEIEPVRSPAKAAWYMAKYLTKASHLLAWPKFTRRVNLSRNWPKPEPLPNNPNWAIERLTANRSVQRWVSVLTAEHWAVECYTE